MPFWIQIHGLDRDDVNHANTPLLLNKVGTVMEVDDPIKTGAVARHFLRARVVVNVRNLCGQVVGYKNHVL